jgi:hypothetical protein
LRSTDCGLWHSPQIWARCWQRTEIQLPASCVTLFEASYVIDARLSACKIL